MRADGFVLGPVRDRPLRPGRPRRDCPATAATGDRCQQKGSFPRGQRRGPSGRYWDGLGTENSCFFVKMILEAKTPIGNVAPRRFAVLSYVRLAERNLPMKWLVACVITTVALAGCKSSQTPFNTLAPFGSARVPPPSTNHVTAPGNYYKALRLPRQPRPPCPARACPSSSATGGRGQRENDVQHERHRHRRRLAAVRQNGQHGGNHECLRGPVGGLRRPARVVSSRRECDEKRRLGNARVRLGAAAERDAGERCDHQRRGSGAGSLCSGRLAHRNRTAAPGGIRAGHSAHHRHRGGLGSSQRPARPGVSVPSQSTLQWKSRP